MAISVSAMALFASPRAEGQRRLTAAELDREIRSQVDSGFAGVVLVARGDSIVLRRAYDPRARLTPRTPFWIASITKSFTAAAILMLQAQHRLSLDDSISGFFHDAPRETRGITIRQLLTHTAGFGASYTGGGITDRKAAVRAILAQPLAYPPGQGYRYGDDDYELLAAVLEVVTGRPWQTVVQREVLDAAGLHHTGFSCASSPPRDHSSLCTARSADWGHRGANGMWSTADDLLRWALVLRDNAIGAFREVETPHVQVRREGLLDVAYGYGVRLYVANGHVVEAMHSGSGDRGHSAVVRDLASGTIIVVLSNAGQHQGTTWSSYVAAKLAPR